jgi:bifunctional hydroxylase/dehydrase
VNRVVLYERGAVPRQRQETPSFPEVADAWERLTGEDIHGGRALWVSWFTDASRQVGEYRKGRVLLAGDAAHVHLPIGGQGLSAGVQDAVNLGWKLAAVIRGHAPPGLLDTYHSERHPVGARVLANTLAQRILYLGGDDMQPLREVFGELLDHEDVRRHLVGMVTGLDIHYDMGPGNHRLLGRRVPDEELVCAFGPSAKTSVFEHLHTGRGVLFDLADDPRARTEAQPWSALVDVVTAAPHAVGAHTELEGVSAVLVRPDGYSAWVSQAGASAAGLTDALTRWFGPPRGNR